MDYSKFIVFEGIDGSGKSTQCAQLAASLQARGLPCHSTYEPHAGVVGSYIRDILKAPTRFLHNDARLRDGVLAHLFAADRYEHVYSKGGICELLSQNTIVICDRYVYSSLAYQGDVQLQELVRKLNQDFPSPDCVFYFDIDIERALTRITRAKDSMEQATFLREVQMRYEAMFKKPLHNSLTNKSIPIYTIDATQDAQSIAQAVLSRTLLLLERAE